MRVLVSNDDGILAEGLKTLSGALLALGHTVWVVAPRHNWSGGSQSVTVDGWLEVNRLLDGPGHLSWYVDGSPADCIRIAPAILPASPDVVLSGINHGPNLGADVYRSGTVGAAREAALFGWPAVALSAWDQIPPHPLLHRHLPAFLELAQRYRGQIINVNLPPFPAEDHVWTHIGWHSVEDHPVAHPGGREGQSHVRLTRSVTHVEEATDMAAVLAGKVSVSVLPVESGFSESLNPGVGVMAGENPA